MGKYGHIWSFNLSDVRAGSSIIKILTLINMFVTYNVMCAPTHGKTLLSSVWYKFVDEYGLSMFWPKAKMFLCRRLPVPEVTIPSIHYP